MGREISPGARLKEHLTLVRALGRGAMGQVWLADDTRLGHQVAVKFLAYGRERDPSWVARFEREFATAAAIDSPHVIRMYDHDWTGEGIPYIVIQFSFGQIATVLRQAGDALDAAHDSGVVHRDLKPDNVILVGDSEPINLKLLDFGLAKAWSRHTLTATGVALGTPDYMSPEQALGAKDVDHRADLWSLAVVVYRMLCGRYPFHAANVQALMLVICRGLYKPPSVVGGPSAFDPFFDVAFQPQKVNRFASAQHMLAAFERIVAKGPRRTDEDTDTAIFRPPDLAMGKLQESFDDSAVTRLVAKDNDPEARSYDSATDTNPILLQAGRAATTVDAAAQVYGEPPEDDDDYTQPMASRDELSLPGPASVPSYAGRDEPSFPVPAPTPSHADRDAPSLPVPAPTPSHADRDAPSLPVPAPTPSHDGRDGPTGPSLARPRRPSKAVAVVVGLAAGAACVLGFRHALRSGWLGQDRPPAPTATAGPPANPSASSIPTPSGAAATPTTSAATGPDEDDGTDAGGADAGSAEPADAGQAPGDSAYLTILCRPGCQVWLGRESLGESPVLDKPLPPGKHRVVVYRAPVGSKVLKLDLEPGERASYEVTMRRPATSGPFATGGARTSTPDAPPAPSK
ncbi:MAG: protein kinase [Deltaproteobacteria bacterium]|nr:protein kinase [Deltaproteobacteria bacterium]